MTPSLCAYESCQRLETQILLSSSLTSASRARCGPTHYRGWRTSKGSMEQFMQVVEANIRGPHPGLKRSPGQHAQSSFELNPQAWLHCIALRFQGKLQSFSLGPTIPPLLINPQNPTSIMIRQAPHCRIFAERVGGWVSNFHDNHATIKAIARLCQGTLGATRRKFVICTLVSF